MSDEALARLRATLVRLAQTDPVSGSGVSPEYTLLSRADTEALVARLDVAEQPPLGCRCSCSAPDLKLKPTFFCRNCQNVFVP